MFADALIMFLYVRMIVKYIPIMCVYVLMIFLCCFVMFVYVRIVFYMFMYVLSCSYCFRTCSNYVHVMILFNFLYVSHHFLICSCYFLIFLGLIAIDPPADWPLTVTLTAAAVATVVRLHKVRQACDNLPLDSRIFLWLPRTDWAAAWRSWTANEGPMHEIRAQSFVVLRASHVFRNLFL